VDNGDMNARRWDAVREFALGLPAAVEDFPWGRRDAPDHSVSMKLTRSHELAITVAEAVPTTISGLGQWGWLTVRLATVDLDLVYDWVDESYRNVAPKKLVALLDARPRPAAPGSAGRRSGSRTAAS
jgi:hypothetical protein